MFAGGVKLESKGETRSILRFKKAKLVDPELGKIIARSVIYFGRKGKDWVVSSANCWTFRVHCQM